MEKRVKPGKVNPMVRPSKFDMMIYRLFFWRWSKILKSRPDLALFIEQWLTAYRKKNSA